MGSLNKTDLPDADGKSFPEADREFANLRELRWSKGLTAETCAGALGLDLYEFMCLERGRRRFTHRERAALAEILEVSAAELGAVIRSLPRPQVAQRSF